MGEACGIAWGQAGATGVPGRWRPFETRRETSWPVSNDTPVGNRMTPSGTRGPDRRCYLSWKVKEGDHPTLEPRAAQTGPTRAEFRDHSCGRPPLLQTLHWAHRLPSMQPPPSPRWQALLSPVGGGGLGGGLGSRSPGGKEGSWSGVWAQRPLHEAMGSGQQVRAAPGPHCYKVQALSSDGWRV